MNILITCPLPKSNPYAVTIGTMRDDGDMDVIAAVNTNCFADDGQALRAIVALIQSAVANSEDVVVLERQDLVDVLTLGED